MSNISTVEYHNIPKPGVAIEPVGTEPRITYHVDWEDRPDVDVRAIHKLHDAQVAMAIAGAGLSDQFGPLCDEAQTAINELVAAITDHYIDDRQSHDWYNLYMGNLDEIPGVEKTVEQVRVGEEAEE